jgi:hypothetical protein
MPKFMRPIAISMIAHYVENLWNPAVIIIIQLTSQQLMLRIPIPAFSIELFLLKPYGIMDF